MSNQLNKAAEIISSKAANGNHNNEYCIISQEDLDGLLTSSVISVSKAEGMKTLTFCTGLTSNKTKRIQRDNRASICFSSDSYFITLIGRIEILTDKDSRHENWYVGLENHFSGPDDPNYCVLKFTAERYKLFIDWEESEGVLA